MTQGKVKISTRAAARERRLAEALRANLRRRKSQQRRRGTADPADLAENPAGVGNPEPKP